MVKSNDSIARWMKRLLHYLTNTLSDWNDQLPFVAFNYNTTSHSTAKINRFEPMYAHSSVLPRDTEDLVVSLPSPSQHISNVHQ